LAFAFVDDSGSGGDSPYYVLAGYSADKSTWESFWADWQGVLDLSPKLNYFKMSEAESLKGQFLNFTRSDRDARLAKFIDVILNHDLFEASVAIKDVDYREVLYPVLDRGHASPYYCAFIGMATALSGRYRHSGSDEIVHFIFDTQGAMEDKMLRLYDTFRGDFRHWKLGSVEYRSDKDVLPLQAADLIAWQTRRFLCSTEGTRDEIKRLHSVRPPFRSILKRTDVKDAADAIRENIPRLKQQYGEDRVDDLLASIARRNQREGIIAT
jgi:hypothetical protein